MLAGIVGMVAYIAPIYNNSCFSSLFIASFLMNEKHLINWNAT